MSAPQIPRHPNGYPECGLVARTLPLHFRRDANLSRLARTLERWEHERGNRSFHAVHLDRLAAPLAFELVHVYVAMRERYPLVRPDYVDFCSTDPDPSLAWAFSYRDVYPLLRNLRASGPFDGDAVEELLEYVSDEHADIVDVDQLRDELDTVCESKVHDLSATGAIEVGEVFRTDRNYRELLRFWDSYNMKALQRGRPRRSPRMQVSAAAATLIHEFGHLVEAELMALGYEPLERTYRDISVLLLGGPAPSDRQWRHHLINFPAYRHSPLHGPCEGSPARGRQTRRVLRTRIGHLIGTYALTSRDEIFAETFAVAYGAEDPLLRQHLSGFIARLRAEGVAARRLPNRNRPV